MTTVWAAIVEDDAQAAASLRDMLERYGRDHELQMVTETFSDAMQFFFADIQTYTMVFLDIELPLISGMEAARRIRARGSAVPVIFTTNLAELAAEGYKVQAWDYLVKPVSYARLSFCLDTLHNRLQKEKWLVVRNREGALRILCRQILYLEVRAHHVYIHMGDKIVDVWGTLKEYERLLPQDEFFSCSACYLVSLRYVTKIEDEMVYVDKEPLKISRAKKKAFLKALDQYYSKQAW